ncbi:hypothetical protein [Pseudomonas indica]|uniref:hypothetical protein n=1 Tax=Pseudomonas indica TaxID=137658 RepID=UPI000BABA61C|nr:hypothetical protein [Pseudomonas indica]MBU3056994.1 hypothetical protein [Pseudomonas indica]PAU55496.1 hypothetical protein BZL42_18975 [Pseudomonas indica]
MADVIPFPPRPPAVDIPDCPFQADAEMRLRVAQQAIQAVLRQEGRVLASPWIDVGIGAVRLLDEVQMLYRRSLQNRH